MSDSKRASAWTPLRIRAFRALWLAALASNIGMWMQTVGAQWLLVRPVALELAALVPVAADRKVLREYPPHVLAYCRPTAEALGKADAASREHPENETGSARAGEAR